MQTTTHTTKNRRHSFRSTSLTYKVVCGCLVVTLTREAGKRWGVYLDPGYDGPTHHDYRVALKQELRDLAREQGAVSVEVYSSGKAGWLVDQIEILD